MKLLAKILLSAISVYISAELISDVTISSFWGAIITAVVLGLLNALLKPVLELLSFPITVFTLGLFMLVINGAIVLLCSHMLSVFSVDGFLTAIIFSIVFSVVNWIINALF